MSTDLLSERGRALEDKFFADRDQQLLAALRAKTDSESAAAELGRETGLSDTSLLSRLVGLGVRADTLAAFSVVPMLHVAWGDNVMDTVERESILLEAVASGMARDSSAFSLLSGWLTRSPNPDLFKAWLSFQVVLDPMLSPEERATLRDDVLVRAERIARASGGFLGIGAVSSGEKAALAELRVALGA